MTKYLVSAAVASLWAQAAIAHPGHGVTPPSTILHFIAEPVHAGALLAGALVVYFIARKRRTSITGS